MLITLTPVFRQGAVAEEKLKKLPLKPLTAFRNVAAAQCLRHLEYLAGKETIKYSGGSL